MNSYFEQTFKQTVPLRTKIIQILQGLEICIALLAIVGTFFILNRHPSESTWYQLGVSMGQFSLILFVLTILSGTLRRLDRMKYLRQLLMLFRRHLGILTYVLAAGHGMLTSVAFRLSSADPFAVAPAQFELFGIGASMMMAPLFLTSNNLSVKKLGKWWGRLHKLVYIIGWFIAIHVVMQDLIVKQLSIYTLVIVCAMVVEMVSFGVEAKRKMMAKRMIEEE